MDIDEMGLIPDRCLDLRCKIQCHLIDRGLCPLIAMADRAEMAESKQALMKEAEELVK